MLLFLSLSVPPPILSSPFRLVSLVIRRGGPSKPSLSVTDFKTRGPRPSISPDHRIREAREEKPPTLEEKYLIRPSLQGSTVTQTKGEEEERGRGGGGLAEGGRGKCNVWPSSHMDPKHHSILEKTNQEAVAGRMSQIQPASHSVSQPASQPARDRDISPPPGCGPTGPHWPPLAPTNTHWPPPAPTGSHRFALVFLSEKKSSPLFPLNLRSDLVFAAASAESPSTTS
ncbi:hypothetical protein EYF80_010530 [Liparis tanakae]|uniref:Uncharacterized protein n=1 Tax=Liparis tanakae TaxID=230148 RepID=A0A4Z2IN45_9TELE|nr:hypothetical protein EYF80_010530 [Liparis tanakae]